jgi:hypothetical protein
MLGNKTIFDLIISLWPLKDLQQPDLYKSLYIYFGKGNLVLKPLKY